jgi:hypothetical protein
MKKTEKVHELLLTCFKKPNSARCQWLTPVILATQKAEIRRIMVQSQPPGKQLARPYLKNTHHNKGWWSGSR